MTLQSGQGWHTVHASRTCVHIFSKSIVRQIFALSNCDWKDWKRIANARQPYAAIYGHFHAIRKACRLRDHRTKNINCYQQLHVVKNLRTNSVGALCTENVTGNTELSCRLLKVNEFDLIHSLEVYCCNSMQKINAFSPSSRPKVFEPHINSKNCNRSADNGAVSTISTDLTIRSASLIDKD